MLQAILGNELGHFNYRLSSVSSLYRSHIRWLSHRSLRNINVMDNVVMARQPVLHSKLPLRKPNTRHPRL